PVDTTVQNAKKPEWTVQNFDYHASYIFSTPAHQNSWGYVNFNLTNNLSPPTTAVCSAASSQLSDFFYGTVSYACTLPADAPEGSAVGFLFSRPSGKLDIHETVVVGSKTFTASGSANLTLSCTDSGTVVTPDWQIGEIYSVRDVECAPVTVKVKPSSV
ncbi:hypothetical protein B0T17DRAFT_459803, partial [Bombardia bombarda]